MEGTNPTMDACRTHRVALFHDLPVNDGRRSQVGV